MLVHMSLARMRTRPVPQVYPGIAADLRRRDNCRRRRWCRHPPSAHAQWATLAVPTAMSSCSLLAHTATANACAWGVDTWHTSPTYVAPSATMIRFHVVHCWLATGSLGSQLMQAQQPVRPPAAQWSRCATQLASEGARGRGVLGHVRATSIDCGVMN